jgi:hypothetical protein
MIELVAALGVLGADVAPLVSDRAYEDLLWIVRTNASAPEKKGCANRTPFSQGYACDSKEWVQTFTHGDLFVEMPQLSNWNGHIRTVFFIPRTVCLKTKTFEKRLMRHGGDRRARVLKSYDVHLSDAADNGELEQRIDEIAYLRARLSLTYEIFSGRFCLRDVDIQKPD